MNLEKLCLLLFIRYMRQGGIVVGRVLDSLEGLLLTQQEMTSSVDAEKMQKEIYGNILATLDEEILNPDITQDEATKLKMEALNAVREVILRKLAPPSVVPDTTVFSENFIAK